MHTRQMHRAAAAVKRSVNRFMAPGGAFMSSIAQITHRRIRVRPRRRAICGAVFASLIEDQYALEAHLRVLDPPPSCGVRAAKVGHKSVRSARNVLFSLLKVILRCAVAKYGRNRNGL